MSNNDLIIPAIDANGNVTHIQTEQQALSEGGEGIVLRSTDRQYIIKLYRPHINRDAKSMLEILSVAPAPGSKEAEILAWPTHIVPESDGRIAGVVMPNASQHRWMENMIWYIRPKSFLSRPEDRRGDLRGFIAMARDLAHALRFLNFKGYGHADLSGRNVMCNPVEGRAVVIDLDGLVVPDHMYGDVLGTPGYMAPELIDGMLMQQPVRPNAKSDRHALAVLLYELLLWHHPLTSGKRPPLHAEAQMDDILKTSSQHAIYVYHPTDRGNRPHKALHVDILGNEMARLFERAFVQGIRNPDERPHPSEWERALGNLYEDLVQCSNPNCAWKWAPAGGLTSGSCPMCGHQMVDVAIGKLNLMKARQPQSFFYATRAGSSIDLKRQHTLVRREIFGKDISQRDEPVVRFAYRDGQWHVHLLDKEVRAKEIHPANNTLRDIAAKLDHPLPSDVLLRLELNGETRVFEIVR